MADLTESTPFRNSELVIRAGRETSSPNSGFRIPFFEFQISDFKFRISPAGRTAWCLVLLVLAAGCAPDTSQGRKFERLGQFPQAYECYSKALAANAGDSAAADGLKRSAPRAVEYWQDQAVEAAQAGQWQRAAQCHLKVLQIQPNDNDSLLSLRDIARLHPREVETARSNQLDARGRGVEDQLELASAGPAKGGRTGRAENIRPLPPLDKLGAARVGSGGGPESLEGPPAPGPAITAPAPPRPEPAKPEPPKPEIAAAPPPAPARPVPIDEAPKASAPRPERGLRFEELSSLGEFLQVARLSKKDSRYYDVVSFYGGLALKLRSTDNDPDRADMELYYGSKKLGRYKKLVPNSVMSAVGSNGRVYDLVVLNVVNKSQTVTVGLRASK